jgi:O-acetyl-ADP-ribose deacetylase (regulator of RNase III)
MTEIISDFAILEDTRGCQRAAPAADSSPMLRYVAIDLFDSPAQTLVNTVNTVGVMGKGIAQTFKRLYPDMYRAYRTFCHEGRLDIGQLYLYKTPNKWVLNFPTKRDWRNPSRLEWIEAGLEKFVQTYAARGISSISFPQLGTGNGGLAWSDVQPLMDRYLHNLPIPVFIHTAVAPADFVPEHLDRRELQELRTEYRKQRESVSFDEFLKDLSRVLPATCQASPDGLPELTVHTDTTSDWVIAGEDLADLWQSLVIRGALRPKDFPQRLRDRADFITPVLLSLRYIESVPFEENGSRAVGIRFAPAARQHAVAPVEVHAEG